jgi:hypothetical protein
MGVVGLRNWLKKHLWLSIVQEVPPEIQACEACRVVNCNRGQFTDCVFRLREEAAESQRRARIANPRVPARRFGSTP